MKFSEFPYQRPDYEQLMSRISELTRQFQSAQTADEQLAILKQLEQLRIELRTSVQIATIRYTVDTRDAFYSAEEEYNEQMAPVVDEKLQEFNKALVASPFRKELEEIAKVCVEQDIYVICDEIYYHLVYDGEEFVSLASISPEIKERTLLVNGVSKSYAMTGWRIGYVAANDQVSKVIANYLSHCTGSPSSISQKAAVTALTASQESVEVMRKAFERRRDYMVERMNSIEGVSCIKPHGAFYVMMNIEKLIGQELHGVVIRDADDFGNLFLKYGKVAVVPGTGFGAPTFVRWSYATSIENIKEGLNRLERFLKGETI